MFSDRGLSAFSTQPPLLRARADLKYFSIVWARLLRCIRDDVELWILLLFSSSSVRLRVAENSWAATAGGMVSPPLFPFWK